MVDERKARAAVAFEPAVAALAAADRERLLRLLARMTDALAPPPQPVRAQPSRA